MSRIKVLGSARFGFLFIGLAFIVAGSGCSREAKSARALKRANHYFQQGKLAEAKIEYANVLELDPENSEALKRMGLAWSNEGAPLRALPYLVRASRKTPSDAELRLRVASSYLAIGARSDAAKEVLAILESQPDHGHALLLLADSARTPVEIGRVKKRLTQFPEKNSVSFLLAQSSVSLKEGDLANAEAAIKEAIKMDAKEPLAHLALANLAVVGNRLNEAATSYRSAAAMASPRTLPKVAFAEFLLQCGKPQEADKAIKDILEETPDYLPARKVDAQIAFALGDKEGAMARIREVLRRDPENFDGALLRAQMLVGQGKLGEAADALGRMDRVLPNSPAIRFELARVASLESNPDRAIQILEELVRGTPDHLQAVLVLNELRLRQGDASTAVAALQSVCRKRQNFVPAKRLLAQGYRALGRHAEAVAVYRELLQTGSQRWDLHFHLGSTYREVNQLSEAELCFLEAAKLDPAALAPLAQLMEIDLLRKDYAKAAQRIAERMQARPPSAELLLLQARVEAAEEKWEQAESSLKRAGDLNPSLPGVYELLIRIYVTTDRLADAREKAEALCERNPNDIRALTTAAVINGRLGDTDKAINAYERLLAKKPESTIALNNLACIYVEQPGQLERAHSLARRARAQQPFDPAIADTLGWACFKRKEYSQALALLQESSGQLSQNAEAMFHFGMACYATGLSGQAVDAFEKAKALPQEFAAKAELSWRLELLRAPEKFSIDQLNEMLKQHPDDAYVRLRLGERLRDAGEHAKAAEALESALKVSPQMVPAIAELAMLSAGPLQKPEVAAELLRKARAASARDINSNLTLGRVACRIGDWTGAYALLQEALSYAKPETPVPLEFARAAYALGKVSEATELISRVAVSGAANDREEAKGLLKVMRLANDASDAERDQYIQEAVIRAPDDPLILMAAGKNSQKRGNLAEAAVQFSRVLQLLPDFPMAQKELAGIYRDDPAKLARAHDLAVKARRSLPDDVPLMLILAETSFHRKEFAYARQLLEESARWEPLTARGKYFLGVSIWELKDARAAAETLRRALAEDLPDPFRADARRVLKLCEGGQSLDRHGS